MFKKDLLILCAFLFSISSLDVNDIGSSKKWYWQANKPLHVGLGPCYGLLLHP